MAPPFRATASVWTPCARAGFVEAGLQGGAATAEATVISCYSTLNARMTGTLIWSRTTANPAAAAELQHFVA